MARLCRCNSVITESSAAVRALIVAMICKKLLRRADDGQPHSEGLGFGAQSTPDEGVCNVSEVPGDEKIKVMHGSDRDVNGVGTSRRRDQSMGNRPGSERSHSPIDCQTWNPLHELDASRRHLGVAPPGFVQRFRRGAPEPEAALARPRGRGLPLPSHVTANRSHLLAVAKCSGSIAATSEQSCADAWMGGQLKMLTLGGAGSKHGARA